MIYPPRRLVCRAMSPEWTLVGDVTMAVWFDRRCLRLRHRAFHSHKSVPHQEPPFCNSLGDILQREEGPQIDIATLVQILGIDMHEARGRHMQAGTLQDVSFNRLIIQMNVLHP